MTLPLFLILLLITAIGSSILFARTSHDVFGVLATLSAIAFIICALAVSHWSIHLLGLFILLGIDPLLRIFRTIEADRSGK